MPSSFLSLRTSALKWCGNPPVERNQVTITAKNRGDFHSFRCCPVHFPSNGGIATTSVRTGLAMTGNLKAKRYTPIKVIGFSKLVVKMVFVVDGPIRDVDEIAELGIPVYATGSTPGGPYKEGPGEVNTPISCGGVSVSPGDIVLGDSDGVIIIPRKDAARVLREAREFAKLDAAKMQAALEGRAKRDWVDKKLMEKGCEIIEGCCEDQ